MTTTHAPDAAERIINHLSDRPIVGVTLGGWIDSSRPEPSDIGGWASDTDAEAAEPEYTDAAIVYLGVGTLSLNGETGIVRWALHVQRESEFGLDVPALAASGELDGEIAPVIDAIRAAAESAS